MVFLVWSLILIVFKCCGRRRFGCASGVLPLKPNRPPSAPTDRDFTHIADSSHSEAMREAGKKSFARSSKAPGRGDTSAENDGKVPTSVQKWLDTEQRKEEEAMEEAESEIVKSARASGIMMAATSVSYDENFNASQKIPPEQAPQDVYEYGDEDDEDDAGDVRDDVDDADDAGDAGDVDDADDVEDAASVGEYTGSTQNAENVSPDMRMRQYSQRQMESRDYFASMRKFNRRVRMIRTIFLLAGVGVLVATALFYAKGLMSLKNSLEDTQATLSYGESILDDAHNLTTSYIDTRKNVQEEVDNMRYSADEFCPTNLGALERLNLTTNQTELLQQRVASIRDSLGNLGDMLMNEFEDLEKDLTNMMNDVAAANDALDDAYPFLWAGTGAVGGQIVITVCLMAEVIMASRGLKMQHGCAKCMRNAVILPLFFLFTILAWLFASLFLLAAISGSDVCVDPDKNMLTYLNGMVARGEYSEVLIDYFAYFVKCIESARPIEIPKEAVLVYDALGAVHNFTEYLASEESVAADVCTPIGADLITSLSDLVHAELHGVGRLFNGIMQLMQCSTFNPLYSTAAYQALCINGVDGLNWMFGTQLAVAICAMTMITLRAARHEGEEIQARDLQRGSFRRLTIGAKSAPWEAAAVAALMVADDRPVSQQRQEGEEEEGEEDVAYVVPCEEDCSRADGQGDQMVDDSKHEDVLYRDEPFEDEGEGQDEFYEDEYEGQQYHEEPNEDEPTPAGSASGQSEADESRRRDEYVEKQNANFEILETLSSDQVEAIENIGVQQAQTGQKYEKDELEVQLLSIPGLSLEQINAVIELELLTRTWYAQDDIYMKTLSLSLSFLYKHTLTSMIHPFCSTPSSPFLAALDVVEITTI